ncbi:MAG: hypothetical protein LBP65_01910 [Puniceicoccales bacterium]|jgi:hypothetical protein|nr:hypothetical protein [Puniceicoccales bacterium]
MPIHERTWEDTVLPAIPRAPYRDPYARRPTTRLEDMGRAIRSTWMYQLGSGIVGKVYDYAADIDDGDYDWKEFSERYAGRYPEKIFQNASSAHSAQRAMVAYDQEQQDRMAQSAHPVTNFFLNGLSLGLEMGALSAIGSPIPFVGGLTNRLAMGAARPFANSILKGVVQSSTALALNTAEVDLARILSSEFDSLGESAGDIPAHMALAGLVGGAVGGASAAWRGWKAGLFRGSDPVRRVELAASLEEKLDPEPPKPGEVPTVEHVVGLIPKENLESAPLQNFIHRIGVSHVVRASTAPCPVTRWVAMNLADSRGLRSDGEKLIQAVEIPIRTARARTLNGVSRALEETFAKQREDRRPELNKISREEFHKSITDCLIGGGESPNPYVKEASGRLRGILNEFTGLYKEADLANRRRDLTAQAELEEKVLSDELANLEKVGERYAEEGITARAKAATDAEMRRIERLGALRDWDRIVQSSFDESIRENVAFHDAVDNSFAFFVEGRVRTEDALEKLGELTWKDVKLDVEMRLREKGLLGTSGERKSFDRIASTYGKIYRQMAADEERVDDRSGAEWKRIEKELNRLEGAGERVLSALDREFSKEANRWIRTHQNLRERFTGRERSRSQKYGERLERLRMKLAEKRHTLERLRRGDLTDGEWGILPNYVPRIWDVQAIATRTPEFVKRIQDWLVRVDALPEKSPGPTGPDAYSIALNTKNKILGNSYQRTELNLTYKIQRRGMELERELDIPTVEVLDFVVRDPLVIFDRLSKTIIPDHAIKMRLGTLSTEPFEKEITKWYDGQVLEGKMEPKVAQGHIRKDVDALRGLMARIRNMSALSGEALWRNPTLKAGLGVSRSVTSAIMLGALPATALQDFISIGLTSGFGRFFVSAAPRFIRFLASKSFRSASKKDLHAFGVFVDCMVNKNAGRTSGDSLDPTLMSRMERFGERMRAFSYRYSGAEAVLEAIHDVAVPTAVLDLWNISKKIRRGKGLSVHDRHLLNFARLDEGKLLKIAEQIEAFGSEDAGMVQFNLDDWTDGEARENIIYATNNLLDMYILNPGHETPVFGPLGNLFWQFKRFAFAAYDRCLLPTLQRLADWEFSLIAQILASILLGSLRDVLDRAVEGREMPEPMELLIAGIAKSDLLPFVGDFIKNLNDGFSSQEALPTALGRGLKEFFIPPSVSQWQTFALGANGIAKLMGEGTPISRRDARAIKQSILFNNHYLFRRALHNWQESLSEPRN